MAWLRHLGASSQSETDHTLVAELLVSAVNRMQVDPETISQVSDRRQFFSRSKSPARNLLLDLRHDLPVNGPRVSIVKVYQHNCWNPPAFVLL